MGGRKHAYDTDVGFVSPIEDDAFNPLFYYEIFFDPGERIFFSQLVLLLQTET